MECAHENDDVHSSTPPNREILLRVRERPEDRREHQEKRLQLLLQEAEELNARLREQLANSSNRPPQQARVSIPIDSRRETEPSTRAPSLSGAQALWCNLEPRNIRKKHPTPQVSPYKGGSPHRLASPDRLSEADSSRASSYGWTST